MVIIKAPKHGTVQLFQKEVYSDIRNQTNRLSGIGSVYELNLVKEIEQKLGTPFFGNAWAISRDLYEKIGYIYDEGIGGGTDYIFASSARNNGFLPWEKFRTDNYYKAAVPWLERVAPIFNDTASFVRGELRHFEHERTFWYHLAIEYIRKNYVNQTLLDVLHREENFSLVLDDPNFGNYEFG